MNERGKSDGCVVPAKPANKVATAVAELVEERHPAKGNTDGETHPGRGAGNGVSRDLDRVREVAVRDKQVRFTALMHHITLNRLRWAYWAISPKAAPGTDGVTWEGTVNLSNPIFAGSPPRFTRSRVTYEAYVVSITSTRPQVDSAHQSTWWTDDLIRDMSTMLD